MFYGEAEIIDKNMTNKKGFTLIEILVVITVIYILVGMVFISIESIKEKKLEMSSNVHTDTVDIEKSCQKNCKIICE
jgi:prepilin-type N-terminal cleavage/methylation domain-containing protein